MTNEPTAEVVLAEPQPPPAQLAPVGLMSLEPTDLSAVLQLADIMANSDMVPAQYQRKPANIVVAIQAGRPLGLGVWESLDSIHVIQGRATMRPEVMLSLVRRAGHSVDIVHDAVSTTVTGRRADNGDEYTFTFSDKDAKAAELAGKKNWQMWPRQMRQWRAVSAVCKALFGDLIRGYYTPDELGVVTDVDGAPVGGIDAAPAQPVDPSRQIRTAGKLRLLSLCDDDRDAAAAKWATWCEANGGEPETQAEVDALLSWAIDAAQPADEPLEAQLVPDDDADAEAKAE